MLLLAPPAGAAPTERVVDGGFEATTCANGNRESCDNPSWTIDKSTTPQQGFFCSTSASCGGKAPFRGTDWLQFGGTGSGASGTATGSASQSISVPAAPATLSFALQYASGTSTGDTLKVSVGGTQVASFTAANSPATYAPQSIPIDAAVGSGSKMLSFAFESPSKACDTAKAKLTKAKAKLKKLKANDAPKDKLKKAKVKKAKAAVKKACKA